MGSNLMRTVYVQACIRFPLGKQGENEVVRVVWPGIVEKFRKLYGSGAFTLTAKRCGDAAAYPVAVSTEGGDVVWLVRAADVANPGSGSCELTYTVDGVVAKSQTWSTYVAASISGDAPGEPPEEPARAWFAAVQAQIGNLDDLTTKAKANLVAAINEAAKTGSGGAVSISMRTADGYIQYSTDGGETWENLIAVADLKGDPGPQGEPGTPGKDGAGMDITGATVGQIAKISAVDENGKPTKWEPVDMASGGGGETWEKLVDTSLSEPVESVTYTFDNCKRVKALIAPVIASGEPLSGWTRITINNVLYSLFNSRIDNMKGIYIKIDSVYPPYVQASIGTNSRTITYGFNGGIQTTALENIAPNGVTEFGCQTAGLLKAGAKIEIWGVKS
nr:MAG TPA: BNR/Asp-box repeat protein [Caudoviricetes sp.]